jgi:ribose-phosphate pyrophosphokinase
MIENMKLLLNLTDVEKSDIAFKVSKFPDGQQSISIEPVGPTPTIQIQSRLNSFRDVELIICANQSLKEMGATNIELYVPYFLGARSDRKFGEGETNYLKNVICPIINSQGFSKVITLDPHSDVLEACLNNFEKENNFKLVEYAINEIDKKENIILVSPDAGAYKKVFDVAKEFQIENIITATKVRDIKTGNILSTQLPIISRNVKYKYVIVDDICDGGRTFIELAKAIKSQREAVEIYLVVTHGIFSAGFVELNKYFKGIFCTDSYRDVADDEYETKTNVKTLKVF